MADGDDKKIDIPYEPTLRVIDPALPFLDVFPREERRRWKRVWREAQRLFGQRCAPFDDDYPPDVSRVPDHLWSWDATTGAVTLVPPAVEYLGYNPKASGLHFPGWEKLVHPADLDKVKLELQARMVGRTDRYWASHGLRKASGGWYQVTACEVAAEHDGAGKLANLRGIFLPNYEKDQLGAEKNETIDRANYDKLVTLDSLRALDMMFLLEFLVGCNDVFVFTKDLNLTYAYMNPNLTTMLGVSLFDVLGCSDREVFGVGADMLTQACEKALKTWGFTRQFTLPVKGELRSFWGPFVTIRSNDGDPICLYGVFQEIRRPVKLQEFKIDDLGSRSPAMFNVLATSRLVAQRDTPVLLTGESGSGKDWLARYIHEHSSRSEKPYFAINCAAISHELAESELFGHEKAAFTGAGGRKRGLLELAEGGTLLLNEIGELSLRLQAKLLTFLDTLSFTRVGGEKMVTVNARLIAATNRELAQEVENGRFRADLFYRLNVFQVRLPALCERTEDIPTLVHDFLIKLASDFQLRSVPVIDAGAMEKLLHHSWPGNVRELLNVLERATIISPDTMITANAINFESKADASPRAEASIQPILRPLSRLTDRQLKQMYEEACVGVDEETGNRLAEPGSLKAMATVTGLSTKTLRRRLTDLGRDPVDELTFRTR